MYFAFRFEVYPVIIFIFPFLVSIEDGYVTFDCKLEILNGFNVLEVVNDKNTLRIFGVLEPLGRNKSLKLLLVSEQNSVDYLDCGSRSWSEGLSDNRVIDLLICAESRLVLNWFSLTCRVNKQVIKPVVFSACRSLNQIECHAVRVDCVTLRHMAISKLGNQPRLACVGVTRD